MNRKSDGSRAIVVTSISGPNAVLSALAEGARRCGDRFIVIGDRKSPEAFSLDGCDFYSLGRQRETGFRYAELCPLNHYARKNIGYLIAIAAGSRVIIETDDDNFPRADFFGEYAPMVSARECRDAGWVNVYRYFSDSLIWPRGLPLEEIHKAVPAFEALPESDAFCPIQQGLADENPDVDAVYRLILPLPISFVAGRRILLGNGSWCPFNSQNTAWFSEAYPLLYLPAYCSFRMTDIWRSFVAQRICWENNWDISFFSSTVWQERNEHRLIKDFEDEVPGYLNNARIRALLEALPLRSGTAAIGDNLRIAYSKLVEESLIGEAELPLLEAWLADYKELSA